jgi:hypothetical protein
MKDILAFNTFITQDVLVFFYYVGAVLMPVVLYVFRDYLIGHLSFFKRVYDKLYSLYSAFSSNEKIAFWLVCATLFLCMELCWRMMFEMMIGYFDMHEYLYKIANEIK